jgi:hypothetical protein
MKRGHVKKIQRIALLLLTASVILMLAGCPQRTTVAKINGDPGAYFNKEVALVGTVSHSYGFLGNGVYQLNDGTGSIWVLAEGYGVPGDGERVGVAGTVIPTLTFAGKSYATGIRETHKRSHP